MSARPDAPAGLDALLDAAEAPFRAAPGPRRELEDVLATARERAHGLADAAGGTAEAEVASLLTFCAEVLSRVWLERPWTRAQVDELTGRVGELLDLPPPLVGAAIYLRAAREQRALELPPHLAIETQLRLLIAFAPVEDASVWTRSPEGQLVCVVGLGTAPESRRSRAMALAVLAGEPPLEGERTRIHGVPVVRWERPVAALVVRLSAEGRSGALALAQEAATTLSPLLHLDLLLDRSSARERALVETTERLLVRLGFDVHDGALQELAALASDLRLFGKQLGEVLESSEHREVVLGRVDDLEARVVAIDAELRDLTQSLEAPSTVTAPLPETVEALLRRLREDAKIDAELDAAGDLEDLTSSQAIALTRIVQEALTNAVDHGAASEIRVRLRGSESLLEVEVLDDGRGFDVEKRLVEAAREGRLGLLGMAERVRLLGGRLDVESRSGGPTRVTARIPRWRPESRRTSV